MMINVLRCLISLLAVLCPLTLSAQEVGPAQVQQAVQGMSPAQAQQAAQGMSPAQMQQAAQGMSPGQIQQLQQSLPAETIQSLPEAVQAEIAAQNAEAAPAPEGVDAMVDYTSSEADTAADAESEADAPETGMHRPRGVSSLEMLYRTNYGSALAGNLTQFGYDLFQSGPTATPSRLAVPDPTYVLGPGDSLRIRIWGSGLDAEYTGAISKEGTINVPKIGIVPVAGLRYGDAEEAIRQEAEKYVQGINISVSLDQLRSMEVYVVGSVRQPGLHLVPAFSTVLGGLMAANGVEKTGSLRRIQLFRGGALHRTVDIYDLLLKGSRQGDVILEDRDVIFVPRIGPTMAVAGAVAEPGIYELSGERTLGRVLALAGDILPQSYTGRMYLRRFDNNFEFVVQDIDTLKQAGDWSATRVQNGDFLEVQLLASMRPMTVRLTGHVWMPDVFRHRPGLKLSDVLTSADLFKPEAMTEYGFINRYDPDTTRISTRKFPLQEVLDHTYDEVLQPLDEIRILSRAELQIRETVQIGGAVWRPLQTAYRPGMTLRDLLAMAGGLREDQAFMDYGYLYRYDPALLDYRMERIDLAEFEAGRQNPVLQAFDRVQILDRQTFDMRYDVTLSGAVWKPGKFNFNQGMTVSDLINLGGGIRFGANEGQVTVTRKVQTEDRMDVEHRVIDLAREGDLALGPYDYVFVPIMKDANLVREVTVSGEVRFPGTYTVKEGERFSELIERAGGYTGDAYFYGIQFLSERAKQIQQESLNKLLDDLEIRAKMFMSEQAQAGVSSADIEAARTTQLGLDAFIQKLRTVRANGRVAIKATDLASFKGSSWDFVLEDGDRIQVPKKPSYVTVVGAVYSPSAYLYQPNLTLGDYLAQSGGITKTADEEYMYVLKANGEVFSGENAGTFWNRFLSQQLMPGDTLVVPENLERLSFLRLSKDIADIVFKIATTAGVAIAAL